MASANCPCPVVLPKASDAGADVKASGVAGRLSATGVDFRPCSVCSDDHEFLSSLHLPALPRWTEGGPREPRLTVLGCVTGFGFLRPAGEPDLKLKSGAALAAGRRCSLLA